VLPVLREEEQKFSQLRFLLVNFFSSNRRLAAVAAKLEAVTIVNRVA